MGDIHTSRGVEIAPFKVAVLLHRAETAIESFELELALFISREPLVLAGVALGCEHGSIRSGLVGLRLHYLHQVGLWRLEIRSEIPRDTSDASDLCGVSEEALSVLRSEHVLQSRVLSEALVEAFELLRHIMLFPVAEAHGDGGGAPPLHCDGSTMMALPATSMVLGSES
jgi:hypothetical protein